jgi:hypothetical protein
MLDELSEDRIDQRFVSGEPATIFRRVGSVRKPASISKLHGQEVTEQHETAWIGRAAQEVFNPWAIACAPSGLELVACLVDVARDLCRVEAIISDCGYVHA